MKDTTIKWFEEKLGITGIKIYVNTYNSRPKYYNFFSSNLDFSFGLYKKNGRVKYTIGYIRNTTSAKDDNVKMIVNKLIEGELIGKIYGAVSDRKDT